jgi:trk system potassium uptake protein TrkH
MRRPQLTPPQIFALGFLGFILIGTLLLSLPYATTGARPLPLLDALFTATSAVCVTGLVVRDVSADFTGFGQAVLLLLIQIGGFGYMMSATLLALAVGKRLGLRERLLMQESLQTFTMEGIARFTKGAFAITLLIESVAALALTLRFWQDFPLQQAAYLGVFHAVSAFNNAGFSLFPDNLIPYRADLVVNVIICSLIILGGIGFLVFSDLYRYIRSEIPRLSVHTKLSLAVTAALLIVGTVVVLLLESSNPRTIGELEGQDRLLASLFQAVAPRTAGFNTLDTGQMLSATLFFTLLLMFIGASPGGTGGGIKTTTFGAMMTALWSTMRGTMDVTLFERRLPREIIAKAFLVSMLGALLIGGITMALLLSERQPLLPVLFEVVSAFGTVGLSVGDGRGLSLSALFSGFGKLLIICTMFLGRLGPLTVGIAVMGGEAPERYRYPEARIMIG